MKTKNILKALAFALLLTTACNKNEIANDENIAEKGYTLPVTVNVTRQGDAPATKATFNDGTKKLSFSTGDQLFVKGHDYSAGGAGYFAGTLTWQSGGTFSGTILTQTAYSGTIDALFTAGSALATLLPANYGNYPYLYFTDEGTYSASVNYDATKTFATSKAIAVEQFSFEVGGYTSGTGFALHPANAILNFTITGLAANTGVDVALSDGVSFTISGSVTTDDLGTATFAAGVSVGTDLNDFSLTVAGNPITLVTESKTLEAGKIYNITRSAAPALTYPIALGDATSDYVGSVVTTDGNVYATVAAASAASETAVAVIAYVGSDNGEAAPYNHGLALALNDANGGSGCQWKTSQTDAGHTKQDSSTFTEESGLQYNATHNSDTYPAFQAAIANNGTAAPTGCSSWFLASGYQWKQMIGTTGLNNLGLQGNAYYWSSTEKDADRAWIISTFDYELGKWFGIVKDNDSVLSNGRVRACLAF